MIGCVLITQQNLRQFEFSKVHCRKFLQILLGDKNATSLCSKNISTLMGQLLYCYGPHYEMGVAHTIGLSQRMSRSKMVPTAHSIVHSGTTVPTRPSPNPFCTTTTGCLHYFDMTFITLWSTQIFYG